jgi:membrane protein
VPDDPTDLTRRDYIDALKRTLKEVKDDDVPGLAAGVAFKMFLSLFPSLLAAVAIFSIVTTPGEIAEMLDAASGVLPNSAIELIRNPLRELAATDAGPAGLAAVAGIATGLVAATGAAISLMKALSRAYDVAETRNFIRQRLVGVALTLALLIALIAIGLLLIAGPQLQKAVLPNVVPPLEWLFAAARFLLALLVLVLLFAFVYWAGPNRDHPSWVWMSPGALFGVIGWLVVAGGFTLYAQTAGNYNETYSGIAGVVVLLIWLQLSMLVILIGAEFNAEVERRRALHLRVGEGAGFAQPAVTGAQVPADVESGTAALAQAQGAAHTIELPVPASDETMLLAAPPELSTPPAESPAQERGHAAPGPGPGVAPPPAPSPRQAGAIAGAVTAAAVFLGFARKRARR